jgi:hypothetical protein
VVFPPREAAILDTRRDFFKDDIQARNNRCTSIHVSLEESAEAHYTQVLLSVAVCCFILPSYMSCKKILRDFGIAADLERSS